MIVSNRANCCSSNWRCSNKNTHRKFQHGIFDFHGKEIIALIETMRWTETKKSKTKKQRELFIELTPNEKIIVDMFWEKEIIPTGELNLNSNLTSSAVAAAILHLELQNVPVSLRGKMHTLNSYRDLSSSRDRSPYPFRGGGKIIF